MVIPVAFATDAFARAQITFDLRTSFGVGIIQGSGGVVETWAELGEGLGGLGYRRGRNQRGLGCRS